MRNRTHTWLHRPPTAKTAELRFAVPNTSLHQHNLWRQTQLVEDVPSNPELDIFGTELITHGVGHTLDQIKLQTGLDNSVQRQPRRRRRPRRPTWRLQVTTSELLDRLLAPRSPLWRQLNPDANATVNCPAAAAAVDEYLGTGQITSAPAGDALSTFTFETRPWSSVITNFAEIRRVVGETQNSFVTVRGLRTAEYAQENNLTLEHYFVLVNRHGASGGAIPDGLFIMDAYGSGQVIPEEGIHDYLEMLGASSFQYFRGSFRVTHQRFDDTNVDL